MYHIILIIFCISLILPSSFVFAQSQDESIKKEFENVDFGNLILDIRTESGRYIPGQVPVISGSIHTNDGKPLTTKIDIIVKDQSDKIVHQASIFAKEGSFKYTGFTSELVDDFTIFAKAEHNEAKGFAKTSFEQDNFPQTKTGMGIFATIGAIVGLLILIAAQNRKKWSISQVEPLRFALLTLCSVIPLIILVALDVQLGQDGPIGMVLMQSSETFSSKFLEDLNLSESALNEIANKQIEKFEWILHFGGSVHDNFQSGVIVPMYVLAFGLIGGYLRFLHKTQRGWFVRRAIYEIRRTQPNLSDEEVLIMADGAFVNANSNNQNGELSKRIIYNNSMEDLALIFLSPILAIASYLLLVQGGVDPVENWPTIAVISFATGLITTEIISRLEGFARTSIANLGEAISSKKTQDDPLKILKKRFAKGEITKKEFEEAKNALN